MITDRQTNKSRGYGFVCQNLNLRVHVLYIHYEYTTGYYSVTERLRTSDFTVVCSVLFGSIPLILASTVLICEGDHVGQGLGAARVPEPEPDHRRPQGQREPRVPRRQAAQQPARRHRSSRRRW